MVGSVVGRKIGQGQQEGADLVFVGLNLRVALSAVGGSSKIRDILKHSMLYHTVDERERWQWLRKCEREERRRRDAEEVVRALL